MTTKGKVITSISVVTLLVLAAVCFFRFYYVHGEGYNTGDLIYFQREGVLFKTYEGKLILTGFKSAAAAPAAGGAEIRSNELKFSVEDKQVAEKLMRSTGKRVELEWKRYLHTLPWRGNSTYVITRVMSVEGDEVPQSVPAVSTSEPIPAQQQE